MPRRGARSRSAAPTGLHEALRADLRGTAIGVTLVTPGKVRSPYFEHNPRSEERIPGIARLYRTLEPEDVARAIVRERREVILPFPLKVTILLHRWYRAPVEGLLAATGWRRGRGRDVTKPGR